MMDAENKALQAKEKAEVTASAEQTRAGLVFTPAVDIFETEKEITLVADMPGVKADKLSIDLHENVLTLDGDAQLPESADEVDVLREYQYREILSAIYPVTDHRPGGNKGRTEGWRPAVEAPQGESCDASQDNRAACMM